MTTSPASAPTTTGRVLHWAAGYDLLVWLFTHGRSRAFRQKLIELARLSLGASVLDVGCGSSRIIAGLPEGSVAVDILHRKLRYARKFNRPLVHASHSSMTEA